MEKDKVSVSIIVLTYNSEQYVCETLESIKSQTFNDFELIISDDGSEDRTIEICQNWLDQNEIFLRKSKIITVQNNTGTTANYNRGFIASCGEWLKYIDGDDVLMNDCIANNIKFIKENHGVSILHSPMLYYNETFAQENFMFVRTLRENPITRIGIKASIQYKILLRGCYIHSPAIFLKRELLENFGGFDERIRLIEDWPMWLKLTYNGIKIFYLEQPTILYRKRRTSICNEKVSSKILGSHFYREREVYNLYIKNSLNFFERSIIEYQFFISNVIFRYFNKNQLLNKIVFKVSFLPIFVYRRYLVPFILKFL